MPRAKAYRSIDEIMDVFKITLGTVTSMIKKHKIDSFTSSGKIQVNAKDFYDTYIKYYNPSLFEVGDKKTKAKTKSTTLKATNSDIFQKLFGTPYKKPTKKVIVSPALIGAKDHSFG